MTNPSNKLPYIIGIDPGKRSTGVAVVDREGKRFVSFSDPAFELKALPAMATLKAVYVERGGWRGRLNAWHLGRATGIAEERLCLPETMLVFVTPKEWKRKVLGNGNASKQDAIDYCVSLGYTPEDDNEAEALCIARYGVWKERRYG